MFDLAHYNLWLFDCDGVILQSNPIKTQAMYDVALHFSNQKIARLFTQYHQENAGITRFVKFRYLFENLLHKTDYENDYEAALNLFGNICQQLLIDCPLTECAESFLDNKTQHCPTYIISAGTETELNSLFAHKQLAHHFTGIYGGPRNKSEIFLTLLEKYPNSKPIYFGDAMADHKVARQYGIDFVFVSQYTDFEGWQQYFKDFPEINIIKNFSCLLS